MTTPEVDFTIVDETVLSGGSRRYQVALSSAEVVEVFVTGVFWADKQTTVITISDNHPLVMVRDAFLNDTDAIAAWVAKYNLTDH